MNIMPMNRASADKKHWVVRWLRYDGYFICIVATLLGIYYGNVYGMLLFGVSSNESMAWLFAALSIVLGGLAGFVAGLTVSLPCWAISMAIDDMHAMRQYMQGFVMIGDKKE